MIGEVLSVYARIMLQFLAELYIFYIVLCHRRLQKHIIPPPAALQVWIFPEDRESS